MTKKLMSVAAMTALLSTGASAFDMEKDGTIIADVTAKTHTKAIYTDGVEATEPLLLSPNRQGDALIYPAFRSGEGWSTEISVRNTKDVAIVAKAVLYAKFDSRELGDFNLYLSPHDVAKFTIKDGNVTSTDGSIAWRVMDPLAGVKKDSADFATKENPFKMEMGKNPDEAGYVIIYSMIEQTPTDDNTKDRAVYHNKHNELFKDYRKMLDVCRESDADTSTPANWRKTFTKAQSTSVKNGTAVDKNLLFRAPNIVATCTTDNADSFKGNWKLRSKAGFTTPSSDALFGEVVMSHGGEDKRSLLIGATALSNYTTDNQIMLWTEGEYAAIQDRRISGDAYNPDGILEDAKTFRVDNAYFTFNKDANKCKNDYAFLLTQPMKRAMIMSGDIAGLWTGENPNKDRWGYFQLNKTPWTDDEGTIGNADIGYIQLNSPLEGTTKNPAAYYDELATFDYDAMVGEIEEDLDTYGFIKAEVAGYIDMQINPIKGLPAIVSQMSSNDVEGEAQINWIYSATSSSVN